ncbi:hypothetical protein RD792_005197 [Penstemon davidsonii]|uniref:F-box domain-containing protein n=1 Tax=Penstemon davidsonii TaxID=160366 RepID=A0ABR0DKQ3_9LAMI|nr:hypothetical protein RD792_005197 [Penstemon davidsonii]
MEKIKICEPVHHRNSAEFVASIDDLLIQILLRQPVKSLFRFKSVSKHWQSLITNPRFCYLRSRKTNSAIGLFFARPGLTPACRHIYDYVAFCDSASTRKLKYLVDTDSNDVLQSCNGLLLCDSYSSEECRTRFYVCNPTTNRISVLPELNYDDDSQRYRKMSLAFDPKISPHYKVVCVQQFGWDKYIYRIVIYSSETGAWGVRGEPFTEYFRFGRGVYLNGAIHWMTPLTLDWVTTCNLAELGWCNSMYFKIDDQVLDKMPRAPNLHLLGWLNKFYFGESCGHLHFAEIGVNKSQFNVYEMRNDYSEWFVKYQVDLSPVLAVYPEMIRDFDNPTMGLLYYNFSVFCIVRVEEDEDESFLVLHIPGKAIRYNLVRKTFKNLKKLEGEFDGHECHQGSFNSYMYAPGYQYIESMSCV